MLIFLKLQYFAQNVFGLTCSGQIPNDVPREWQLLGLEQRLCLLNSLDLCGRPSSVVMTINCNRWLLFWARFCVFTPK